MTIKHEILTNLDEIQLFSEGLKNQNTVLCNGHFNVIHPGHLRFIQYAKKLGEKLIVAIYSDDFLAKDNPKWEAFPQYERANSLAALSDVNYVIILDKISLKQLIEILQPKIYVMGHEYEYRRDNETQRHVDLAENIGARVVYHSGNINYATTALFYESTDSLYKQNIDEFRRVCERQKISCELLLSACEQFSKVKILVLGDTIVDQFIACDPLGMSSEAPVIALKELESKEFIGGAAIVASHVKALGASSDFISVTGIDKPARFVQKTLAQQGVQCHFYEDKERPTTFKIRYMVESQKILRVSRLEENDIAKEIEDQIILKLRKIIPLCQAIILSDFVYGVITPKILSSIGTIAKQHHVKLFGDLQCSTQTGNILKFKDFTLLTPTEREARIALSDKDNGLEKIATDLMKKTNSEHLLITLGAKGFIAYEINSNGFIISEHFPALVNNPVDVAGAGDALLSVMSLALAAGASLMVASALATCAAAISVNRVGNSPILQCELQDLLTELL